jgi:hypothetical protein
MPIYIVPPPAHPTVAQGYAVAQDCRAGTDPLAFADCENKLSIRYKAIGDRSPDFLLGYAIAVFAGADRIERRLRAAPPSPTADHDLAVAGNVALTGRLAVEMAAKKDGVSEADLPGLIFRTSATPQDRWAYWRAKPMPDWLAKQAHQAEQARP